MVAATALPCQPDLRNLRQITGDLAEIITAGRAVSQVLRINHM